MRDPGKRCTAIGVTTEKAKKRPWESRLESKKEFRV